MIVDQELKYDLEKFLFHEARLLDSRRYEEWLDLLDKEIEYKMPMKADRLRRHTHRYKKKDELFVFDDDYESLSMRVKRIRSAACWTEDPPARARHFISNVMVEPGEHEDEVLVISSFLVSVSRMDGEASTFTGERHDSLRQDGNGWKILKRWLYNDQTVITSNDLTIFF